MKAIWMASFTLKEYFRGTLLYAEGILFVITLFLYSHYYWRLEANEVYLALGLFAILISIITTLRVTNRDTNPRIYIIMTKGLNRKEYITGKILAALLLDGMLLIILFFLSFLLTRLSYEYTFFLALIRVIPILLVMLLTIVISLFFSPLVRNKLSIPIGLILIIISFYQPIDLLEYVLPPIQQLIKISYSQFNYEIFIWFFTAGIYIYIFYLLSCYFFSKRELDYESK